MEHRRSGVTSTAMTYGYIQRAARVVGLRTINASRTEASNGPANTGQVTQWTSGFGHQGSSTFFMPSGTTH